MEQELLQYGLSQKEAKVYLACLKTGKATANRVSELANLARSTTYDLLDKLKSLGLISTAIIDNKMHFIANNPEVLITSLEERKNSIKKAIPSLKNIYQKG